MMCIRFMKQYLPCSHPSAVTKTMYRAICGTLYRSQVFLDGASVVLVLNKKTGGMIYEGCLGCLGREYTSPDLSEHSIKVYELWGLIVGRLHTKPLAYQKPTFPHCDRPGWCYFDIS